MREAAELRVSPALATGEVEQVLAQIWTDVLGVKEVGADDDFFSLGGDSLLIIQVVSRAKARGLPVNYKMIFQSPTIRQLAASLEWHRAPVVREAASGRVPLTPIQERFFQVAGRNVRHWNQWAVLELSRSVSPPELETSVRQLFEVHDVLGLRFELRRGEWTQHYAPLPEQMPIQWIHVDPGAHGADDVLESLIEETNERLNPQASELIRVVYLDRGAHGPHKLLIVAHHLIIDNVSFHILVSDLDLCLDQCLRGMVPRLEGNSISYQRWAEALREAALRGRFDGERDYWRAHAPSPSTTIPCDTQASLDENTYELMRACEITFSEQQTRNIVNKLPTLVQCHVNTLLLDALARALCDCFGMQKVSIDIESHGRRWIDDDVDLRKVTGWYTSIYPQRISGGSGAGIYDRLRALDEQLKAVPNLGVGYGVLRYLSKDEDADASLRRAPPAQVCFNYLGQVARGTQGLQALSTTNIRVGASHARDLQRPQLLLVQGAVTAGRLAIQGYYNERFHREETIRSVLSRMQVHLNGLLAAVSGNFQRSFRQLAWSGGERRRLDHALDDVVAFYPLSAIQSSILFQHLNSEGGVAPYGVQATSTLRGPLNLPMFERAWQAVVARHESLRTSFHWAELDAPVQAVHREVPLSMKSLDWRHKQQAEQNAETARVLQQDRLQGFSLDEAASLMRITVIRLAEERYFCIWSHHHIQLDGWSQIHVLREVFGVYRELAAGEPPTLPAPASLAEYFHALESFSSAAAERYWSRRLQGLGEATPFLVGENASAESYRELRFEIDPALSEAVAGFAKRHSLTLHTMLCAVWGFWLAIHGNKRDVVFGNVVAGRPAGMASAESLIGSFTNTVPVRFTVSDEVPVLKWLEGVQQEQASSHPHELLPLARIMRLAQTDPQRLLFESILVLENFPVNYLQSAAAAGVEIETVDFRIHENYPLVLSIHAGKTLMCRINYRKDRIDRRIDSARQFFSTALRVLCEPEADRTASQCLHEISAGYAERLNQSQ